MFVDLNLAVYKSRSDLHNVSATGIILQSVSLEIRLYFAVGTSNTSCRHYHLIQVYSAQFPIAGFNTNRGFN